MTFVHKALSPEDLGALFDRARAGDLSAIEELHAAFTRAEEAAQAALAELVCADLFAASTDQPKEPR